MAALAVDPEKQTDAFYRYKMPRVQTKVEGNGNGIKTVICNISDIAIILCRNVEYPMRFFAHELAATSKFKDEKWILTGQHSQEKIQSSIFDFIKKFVLCKSCRNPETVIRVDAKKNIFLDCKACSRTSDIAPTEKLCNVIIKLEKPVAEVAKSAEATGKDKKEKKSKKTKGETAEHVHKSRSQKEEEIFDQAARQAKAEDDIITEEIEQPNPIHVLREFVETTPPPSVDEFASKVVDIRHEYGLTEDQEALTLVFEALFDKNIVSQFASRHRLLARFVKADLEKYLINDLMLLCAAEESLRPKFHILLKKFYDTDLVSEEAILAWHEKKKGPKGLDKAALALFKEKTGPFVEWLQQDEEDASEEEDADSSEGEGNGRAPAAPARPVPAAVDNPKAEESEDEDEDDVDIDAI